MIFGGSQKIRSLISLIGETSKNWLINHLIGIINDVPWVMVKRLEHPTSLIGETYEGHYDDLRVVIKKTRTSSWHSLENLKFWGHKRS